MRTRLVGGARPPAGDEAAVAALRKACAGGPKSPDEVRCIALQDGDGEVYRVVRTAGAWEFHTALLALEKIGFRASWRPTQAQAARFDAVLVVPG